MAQVFSTVSTILYALAGVMFLAAIITFFAFNVRKVYAELRGNVMVHAGERREKTAAKQASVAEETATLTGDAEEADTVLDDGQIVEDSLVDFYEPGTDTATEDGWAETDDETPTLTDNGECATEVSGHEWDEVPTDVARENGPAMPQSGGDTGDKKHITIINDDTDILTTDII